MRLLVVWVNAECAKRFSHACLCIVLPVWGPFCLFSVLYQITGASSSLNLSVSTFAAKCFHISPMGLLWHKPPFTHTGTAALHTLLNTSLTMRVKSTLILMLSCFTILKNPWFDQREFYLCSCGIEFLFSTVWILCSAALGTCFAQVVGDLKGHDNDGALPPLAIIFYSLFPFFFPFRWITFSVVAHWLAAIWRKCRLTMQTVLKAADLKVALDARIIKFRAL